MSNNFHRLENVDFDNFDFMPEFDFDGFFKKVDTTPKIVEEPGELHLPTKRIMPSQNETCTLHYLFV